MSELIISKPGLARLPVYLHYLHTLDRNGMISSGAIAKAVGYGEVQVRKDLATVSGSGRPKIGYRVEELIGHLEVALDCVSVKRAVIVGAGRLGCALLSYGGFSEYNLSIEAGFDKNERKLGTLKSKPILHLDGLEEYCKDRQIKIGIITVPEEEAQDVCDRLVSCGVKAIWSFAPTRLSVPVGVNIKEENMACSLAVLSARI